ncbi:hypothetical protein R0G64_04915 [Pseudomonas otitidis]|uniref:Uncharacterized protein n=1 Tax=Metapseudomonas otitidis TaxID=319939 RepID=A0ABU3XM72_9GAMM|nr:hypothetical protein [Pseudomonas otitidis]MDV3438709.1 hypothetical protein [Pseudomonas otitidis]MDV3438774.1 hypothetical protein [Pseudomonas otitidis]
MSNLANIATIAAALIALAALSLQYVQARRAHKQIWLRALKKAGIYLLLGLSGLVSAGVSVLSGVEIYNFVNAEGFATRFEIFWLLLNTLNLGFYTVAAGSLLTACVLVFRRGKANAQGGDAEATPAQ